MHGLIYVLNVIVIKVYTMDDKLIERINQFNEIKYGSNDNETRIVFATLKPEGTVTTAPNTKGVIA